MCLYFLLQLGCGQSINIGEEQFLSSAAGSTLIVLNGTVKGKDPANGADEDPMEFVRARLLPLESSELEVTSMSDGGLLFRLLADEGLAFISSDVLQGGGR